jgi:ribosome-binding protein aMBF1 (putative translation factor)
MSFKYLLLLVCAGFILFGSLSNSGVVANDAINLKKDEYVSPVGEQIRKARISHRMTQEELAPLIGISVIELKSIEGNRATPTKEVLFKAQDILHSEFLLDQY